METKYKVLIGVAVALGLVAIGFAVHHHNKKMHHEDKAKEATKTAGAPSAANPGPQANVAAPAANATQIPTT